MLDRFRYDQILLLEGMHRAWCLNKMYDYPTRCDRGNIPINKISYIELTERNFHKVGRIVGTDTLGINIKVSEGSSPAPVNKVGDFICYDLCSSSGTYALKTQFGLHNTLMTLSSLEIRNFGA